MTQFQENSVFWIEVDKIRPNQFQPRISFDEAKLRDLADSIKQYGVLQPLTVIRVEQPKEDGGIRVEYELIAGERRLRASKIAGVKTVPALIKSGEDSARVRLELAIIENLQREDLNPVDRARAFKRLMDEFGLKHADIGKKMGKSREYVSNSLRLLALPEEVLVALGEGKITEGHTRPLLMLKDRTDEQATLFKEIIYKKINVREAEQFARKIAQDKVRNKEYINDPVVTEIEGKLAESLGTRVHIDKNKEGGKITIDFFTNDDLHSIVSLLKANEMKSKNEMLERHAETKPEEMPQGSSNLEKPFEPQKEVLPEDDESDDLYSLKNFSL